MTSQKCARDSIQPPDAPHDGLDIEKLAPGASEEDFAVKGHFRRSEGNAP